MKYLEILTANNELDPSYKEEIVKGYRNIKEQLAQSGVSIPEESEFVFSNHILALMKRMVQHQLIEPLDESIMTGVSDEALEVARFITRQQFIETGCQEDASEIFLVATHIQMAMDAMKGEEHE